MFQKKRILIVDDHPLYRDGLKAQLAQCGEFDIAGEAGTFEQGLSLAKKLKPDLALLDISLPDGGGLELAREIRAALPETRIVIISMHARVDFISAAFQAGASAYMSKESSAEQIMTALKVAACGGQYLDGSLSPMIVHKLGAANGGKARRMDASYGSLTLREQQVMRLLAEGFTAAEIAQRLFVTRKTVENHRYSIMNKLGVKSPVAFVRHAARLGLIRLEEEE